MIAWERQSQAAPTPLTIIGGNDPAFDRTAEIYRLAGAADKSKRK